MSPEDAVALGHLVTGIVGVAFLAAAVLVVALVIPSTRAVIVNWAGRGELSDEAHGELSQIRYEIALLRNEVAELRSLLPGVGAALPSSSATGRLPDGR
jgi:hypothetical protein